jgi:4-amino-4-deoxy-L-arabinose transferase-like glycosyltransferase
MEISAEPAFASVRSSPSVEGAGSKRRVMVAAALLLFLGFGAFLRIFPSVGFRGVGYDEHAYAVFVRQIESAGLWNYDAVVRVYLDRQSKLPDAQVPATRVGFLAPAALAAQAFDLDPISALRLVSALASLALLLATAVISYRYGSSTQMLVLTALMAVAPLQIALAQRALIDGYFAFWAVLTAWCFWETLQTPHSRGWLAGYALALFVLVLTKENAAFVFLALLATASAIFLAQRRWPNRDVVAVSVMAPLLAVLFLCALVGGVGKWIEFYRMFVSKSATLHYAIQMQDGAWYRYLVDFAVLSPVIVLLVAGRIFQIDRSTSPDFFWALFLGFSFLAMSSVHDGMSLRFAAYWDEPLRWLAASQLIALTARWFPRRSVMALAIALVLVVAVDLSQYSRLFVKGAIYDPVSVQLLHASRLVK